MELMTPGYGCIHNSQELIKQMHRVTSCKAGVARLQQKLDASTGSFIWDYEVAITKEQFHLRVERTCLRFMRGGTDRCRAYRRALKYHNPSIQGI